MTLRKEYQEIVDKWKNKWENCEIGLAIKAIQGVAEECAALADKPPKMLTRDEKYELWNQVYGGMFNAQYSKDSEVIIDKIIAAYIAKQREPRKMTVRLIQNGRGDIFPVGSAYMPDYGSETWVSDPVDIEVKK